jgi:protoheme IX farnesyltransferase
MDAGGSLAGAANAINCHTDRDIDVLMTHSLGRCRRTRSRRRTRSSWPDIGVIAVRQHGLPDNPVGAADADRDGLLRRHTILLKRTTPQNIVIGGAAGALPPVIGWAAVTGNVGLPAIILFALVFYWTPPHFWALSLRIRKDYAAAGVPMLPVVKGIPETTRQIALYTVLMVCLTLVFFVVARMGLVFLAGALVLGGLFLLQAFLMWRDGTDARAVRLYRYSITYLTALFALMILDVFVFLPL